MVDLDVAWFEDTPYVLEILHAPEGDPTMKVYDDKESLRLMWAEIVRLREVIFKACLACQHPKAECFR